MPALIPSLINALLARVRGGGGRGGGGGGGGGGGRAPKPEKSLAEKDNEYWAKQGLSTSDGMEAYEAALRSLPKMQTFDEVMRQFDVRD